MPLASITSNGLIRATNAINVNTSLQDDLNEVYSITFKTLLERLETAEKRIKELETAYMEDKLLGKTE